MIRPDRFPNVMKHTYIPLRNRFGLAWRGLNVLHNIIQTSITWNFCRFDKRLEKDATDGNKRDANNSNNYNREKKNQKMCAHFSSDEMKF